MARPKRPHQQNKQVPQQHSRSQSVAQQQEPQILQVEAPSHEFSSTFEGPIPPPSLLKEYDLILPGAAERIIAMAENEGRHRQDLESKALNANIDAQKDQLAINDNQVNLTFRSDTFGQTYGFLISAACIIGSVILELNNSTGLAIVLAGIPSAALVKAFFNK